MAREQVQLKHELRGREDSVVRDVGGERKQAHVLLALL